MKNFEEIKSYFEKLIPSVLTILEGLGYQYIGSRYEVLPIVGGITFYTYEAKKLNRRFEIEFNPTNDSIGVVEAFIKRVPKESKGAIYNSLQMKVDVRKLLASSIADEKSVNSYLAELSGILELKYMQFINGKKFKPDRIFRP